jgi:hypothetical protein
MILYLKILFTVIGTLPDFVKYKLQGLSFLLFILPEVITLRPDTRKIPFSVRSFSIPKHAALSGITPLEIRSDTTPTKITVSLPD